MENLLLNVVFIFLVLGIFLNLFYLWQGRDKRQIIDSILLWLALFSLLVLLVMRIYASGRLPFASMYEFTLLLCGGILIAALLLNKDMESNLLILLLRLMLLILLAMGSSLPSEIRPLMPALQSRWLYAHVATAVIAYGLFALACCWGVLYLVKSRDPDKNVSDVDIRIYKLVVLGFILLTVVIITGAVWAEEVWGNWWSWDPKETWALVTWLVYAAYLHARRTYGWKGRKSAWMVVVGFILVLFTLFGVSILLPGLHSYS